MDETTNRRAELEHRIARLRCHIEDVRKSCTELRADIKRRREMGRKQRGATADLADLCYMRKTAQHALAAAERELAELDEAR